MKLCFLDTQKAYLYPSCYLLDKIFARFFANFEKTATQNFAALDL